MAQPPTSGVPLQDLVAVMDVLRGPKGCRWDAAQSHASLITYLLEEVHELVDAINYGDDNDLREELGDVLLQVVFHARIAAERLPNGGFTMDDVARGITDKLVRRHPHVFGDHEQSEHTDVASDQAWQQRKLAEKGRTSADQGVPRSLPPLLAAQKLLHRAQHHGITAGLVTDSRTAQIAELLADESDQQQALAEIILACVQYADRQGWQAHQLADQQVQRYRRLLSQTPLPGRSDLPDATDQTSALTSAATVSKVASTPAAATDDSVTRPAGQAQPSTGQTGRTDEA